MDRYPNIPGAYFPTRPILDSYGQPVQGHSFPSTQGYAGQTMTGMGVPYQSTSQPSMGATNLIVPPPATYQPNPRVYNPYQTTYEPGPVPRWQFQHLQRPQRERSSHIHPYYRPMNTAVGIQEVSYSYIQPAYIRQPPSNPLQPNQSTSLPSLPRQPRQPNQPKQPRQSKKSRKPGNSSPVQRQTHSPSPQLAPPKAQALPSETHAAPLPETESAPPEAQRVSPESQPAPPTTQTVPSEAGLAPSDAQTIPSEIHTILPEPQQELSETQPLPSGAQREQPEALEIPPEFQEDDLSGLDATGWDAWIDVHIENWSWPENTPSS
ncbi:uncharacterized protein F4817DRAFT_323276 [Daldinia loculata]|uniref:uncharacterized protein n=1 Tax=Daldinia loculata TaxID=103429 RepID=UPI0020C49B3F|nr:uncharacterized protein F4817DRAFT_323276 [Daldinia loculata]KAI1651684.1 hypothetical protein F4817DRAFT_323276 [Daldinia loculata]